MDHEREFWRAVQMAVSCRWRVMGHEIDNDPYGPKSKWEHYLIGYVDACCEMQEIIRLEKEKRFGPEPIHAGRAPNGAGGL